MTATKELIYTDKYDGTVLFSPFMGYGDLVQENLTIKKVSYVKGLGHKFFIIHQFYDKYLEVTLKYKTCVHTSDGK